MMTGPHFDGQQAAEMGLVNSSVPLRAAAGRGRVAGAGAAREEPGRAARGEARLQALRRDELGPGGGLPLREGRAVAVPRHERGREQGLGQFLDEKRIKPGLQTYERPATLTWSRGSAT